MVKNERNLTMQSSRPTVRKWIRERGIDVEINKTGNIRQWILSFKKSREEQRT